MSNFRHVKYNSNNRQRYVIPNYLLFELHLTRRKFKEGNIASRCLKDITYRFSRLFVISLGSSFHCLAAQNDNKQLLNEVFVICGIIKVEVTLTETLIIPHITKTEFNNCFIIHFNTFRYLFYCFTNYILHSFSFSTYSAYLIVCIAGST